MEQGTKADLPSTIAPIRGALKLAVSASSPQVSAGSHFSIFVNIQNPYDVPITIYQVQTHIPIELIDINSRFIEHARRERERDRARSPWWRRPYVWFTEWLADQRVISGVAIAVGTNFNPATDRSLVSMTTSVGTMGEHATVVGMQLAFPENPSAQELDRIFERVSARQQGLIPVTLQPGDSVVKQFVLSTRRWLFFTPLTHAFQIQVNYSADGIDHTGTVSYEQRVAAPLRATVFGAIAGAAAGSTLKSLTDQHWAGTTAFLLALAAAMLSSAAVVIAFARKTAAQPFISVEDFWGGSLIGFSVGYFGFDQFSGLFKSSAPPAT
jgi:hypothetical protein